MSEYHRQLVTQWNAKYRKGTRVLRYKLINPLRDPQPITRTRSPAWLLGGHTAVVQLEGLPGAVAIESLVVCEALGAE